MFFDAWVLVLRIFCLTIHRWPASCFVLCPSVLVLYLSFFKFCQVFFKVAVLSSFVSYIRLPPCRVLPSHVSVVYNTYLCKGGRTCDTKTSPLVKWLVTFPLGREQWLHGHPGIFQALMWGRAGLPPEVWERMQSAKTQYRKFETNIPRKGIGRRQSQFPHSCVCERVGERRTRRRRRSSCRTRWRVQDSHKT